MNKKPLLMFAIVAVGIVLAVTLVKTAPKPAKKVVEKVAPLVEVNPLSIESSRPSWSGGASVNANSSVKLVTQVAGQVEAIHENVVPGAFVKKGTELARIDDANYKLVLAQKQAKVVQAQASLDIEQAQAENAKKDYQRSGIKLDEAAKALALRLPQLASAKAALTSAKAELDKAKLDLQRTRLMMPFDGHIMQQLVHEGAYVNSSNPVFELVASDQYWLEVKVPQNFVSVLDREFGATVNKIGDEKKRPAKVLSVLPQVDAQDRQVRVLISIEDPLLQQNVGNHTPVIRYNDYVQVQLFAKEFENVVKLKSDQVQGRQGTWVVDAQQQLALRSFDVVYRGREHTWVTLQHQTGDQLLVSSLANVRAGMAVRIADAINTQVAKQQDKKTKGAEHLVPVNANPVNTNQVNAKAEL